MAVPDYQTLMLPALQYFADSLPHSNQSVVEQLAQVCELNIDDLRQRIPSGKQTLFANRVGWAVSYLTNAKLLVAERRGIRKITDLGLNVIKEARPEKIDIEFLKQFPDFDFDQRRTKKNQIEKTTNTAEIVESNATPDELLEGAFEAAQHPNNQEILDAILANTPEFFERLVLDVLSGLGYGGTDDEAQSHLGKSGDGGVDGVIREDALGLELIYVQAKRYAVENTIGRPDIQQFAGSLDGFRARKGVFITTSSFSREAAQYAKDIEKRIALIDGEMLIDLMIQADIGVRTVTTYELKAIDQDYFEE